MNKLPVADTIRFGYAFTFGEIGTVIGLIWIPTLINAVVSFFALRIYYQAMAESMETALPAMGGQVMLPLLAAVLSMLLAAMIGVAITRQALGLRSGPAFAHFSLGSAELRVFGGFFGLYMILILGVFVISLVVLGTAAGAAATAGGNLGNAALLGGVVGMLALAGLCAMFYVAVRLSFLIVPAALVDGEFGVSRSWELTKGNFWRIFIVGLVTLLPIAIAFGIAEVAILGPNFFVPDMGSAKDPAAQVKQMAVQMRAMQAHMPLLMGLSFVISPLAYGMLFAPAAFAYRALSGKAVVEHTA